MKTDYSFLYTTLTIEINMKNESENLTEVFRYLRYAYLIKAFGEACERYWIENRINTAFTQETVTNAKEIAKKLGVLVEDVWNKPEFHVKNRITSFEDLSKIGVIANRAHDFDLSVLPLNIAIGGELIDKFIPKKELVLGENDRVKHGLDPYGIFTDESAVKIGDGGRTEKIAVRKFHYAVLFNITKLCITGCVGCYKKAITRIKDSVLAEYNLQEYLEIKKKMAFDEKILLFKTERLVEWMNRHPEVKDIIISGGEPFMYTPKTIEKMLNALNEAKYLKNIRICTSSVFMGMFYLVNDELADTIKRTSLEFEKRGKRLMINAHATNAAQLEALECKETARKLLNAGVKGFWLQVPLQEGINFWRDDLEKSIAELAALAQASLGIPGVHLYKLIVDMNSPNNSAITVPIETVAKMMSVFHMHEQHGDMDLFQAVQVLTPFGNVYINNSLFDKCEKDIDVETKRVTYYFYIRGGKEYKIIPYEEPLIEGHNDKKLSICTEKCNKDDSTFMVRQQIDQVRQLYREYKTKDPNPKIFSKLLDAALPFRCKNEILEVEKNKMDEYQTLLRRNQTVGLTELVDKHDDFNKRYKIRMDLSEKNLLPVSKQIATKKVCGS